MMVLEAEGIKIPEPKKIKCYLAGMDPASRKKAFLLAEELRGEGISCEVDLMERSLKAQFKYADKLGAEFVAVIGESELEEGAAEVKHMSDSSSERVKFEKMAQYLLER